MKPMLAEDFIESKLVFPLIAQPKIDGVRALNIDGQFKGRSLKPFGNRYTTEFYSKPYLAGLDGELAAAHECDPALCRKTTSAVTTHEGQPFTLWWLFDYVCDFTLGMPYEERYAALCEKIVMLEQLEGSNYVAQHLRRVPYHVCDDLKSLLALEDMWLEMGYEGTIIRNPNGRHKQGRSTVREGGLLRIKRFIDAEAEVYELEEGETNLNEATINLLGKTERSSHQENKVPNGMLGNMQCKVLKDVVYMGKVIMQAGMKITVSPGNMDHKMRKHYWDHPEELVGKIITYKFFPKGIKDKPRFPTFKNVRDSVDMSA